MEKLLVSKNKYQLQKVKTHPSVFYRINVKTACHKDAQILHNESLQNHLTGSSGLANRYAPTSAAVVITTPRRQRDLDLHFEPFLGPLGFRESRTAFSSSWDRDEGHSWARTSIAARWPAWTAPSRYPHHIVAVSVPAQWILTKKWILTIYIYTDVCQIE